MKIHDTIIIGGGIAGLACARTLHDQGRSFKLITEDLGGRIATSANGKVNYGAIFTADYATHIMNYMQKGRRLNPFKASFHKRHRAYSLYRFLSHPATLTRFYFLMLRFRFSYRRFRKRCERISQKKAFIKDPFLFDLYHQNATDFIHQHRILPVVNGFMSEGVYLCTFMPLSKLSAFDFCHVVMHLTIPIYEFTFLKDKITRGFESGIIFDSVVSINKRRLYELYTQTGRTYYANHVVVATPNHVSQKLLGLNKIKPTVDMYVFHIEGQLKKRWQDGQLELFDSRSRVVAILPQADGTIIFYYRDTKPPLDHYFHRYRMLAKKIWRPAFPIGGHLLLDAKQGPNLYMIGDYNVTGMEDSFITGLYAANQIMGA